MILGLGNDILEIDRVKSSIDRHGQHFLNRLFTQKEQDYCYQFQNPVPHFAGRFAAKEAISKALGTGFGTELAWHDIEVINDPKGKPVVLFSPHFRKTHPAIEILVSISHCTHYVVATAILIRSSPS